MITGGYCSHSVIFIYSWLWIKPYDRPRPAYLRLRLIITRSGAYYTNTATYIGSIGTIGKIPRVCVRRQFSRKQSPERKKPAH